MIFECPFCSSEVEFDLVILDAPNLWVCGHCFNPFLIQKGPAAPTTMAVPGATDVRSLAPPESLAGQILGDLEKAIRSIPVLPQISQKVMALAKDENSSMADFGALVRTDTVVAAKILEAANSAIYRGLSEITELDAACTRLGIKTLSNIVHSVANGRLFRSDDETIQEQMHRLYRHSIATAYCASQLAKTVSAPNPDSHYLAGLLHDTGKVALLDVMATSKSDAAQLLQKSPKLLFEIISTFHTLIGAHIMCHWKLPNHFRYTTYGHHFGKEVPIEAWRRDVHIVALANLVAGVTGFGFTDIDEEISLLSHPSSLFLGMTDVKLALLRVEMEEKFEELAELLMAA